MKNNDSPHTATGIKDCSCAGCLAIKQQRFHVRLKWRQRMLAEDPSLCVHGDVHTYNQWGCRCDDCRQAARERRYMYGFKTRKRTLHGSPAHSTTPPFGREWLDG